MGLRDIESSLPPGFRFYPNDEELVCHYLQKKVANDRVSGGSTMVEVDLHVCEPWELPDAAKLNTNEWYFFSFRDRKYATGSRTNRATKSGYWKATGKDRTVYEPATHTIVGMRKTLVFYNGRAPNGIKTNWVMHEFRLETPITLAKEDWVLCRVFHKKKEDLMSCNNMDINESKIDDQENNIIYHHYGFPSSHGCYELKMPSSIFPDAPHCHHEGNSSNTILNFALLHYNFLDDFPQDMDTPGMLEVGSGSGNASDYGLMLDLDLDNQDKQDFRANIGGQVMKLQGGHEN